MAKVYEGVADLDIQKFVDGLEKMVQEAGQAALNIDNYFRKIDQSINQTFAAVKASSSGVAQAFLAIAQSAKAAQNALGQGNATNAQALQQQNAAVQQSGASVGQVQQAVNQALKSAFAQRLADQKQQLATQERNLKQSLDAEAQLLKQASAEEARILHQKYADRKALLEKEIEEAQRLAAEKRQIATDASSERAGHLVGGDFGKAEAAHQAYNEAMQAAEVAQRHEASLQRQLSQVVKAERNAQSQAVKAEFNEQQAKSDQAAREFKQGWRAAIKQAFADFSDEIAKIERQWSDVFRAGSQIQSVGSQLTAMGAGLGYLSKRLTDGAGDFDFWNRRIVAAAKSANADLFTAFGGSDKTIQAFQNSVMELGRGLGTLQPEEVAQSWYLYQAAVGDVIKTQDDLATSQAAVDVILKAAIISDTDYETAIRGVTQAMAEFGLGNEQAAAVTQVLLNVTQQSQAEFSDVLEAYKMVGPQAARLGETIASTSAIFAKLSENGIRGSAAGRSLSMVLTTLLDPAKEADETLQNLLVTQQGLTGGWRDLVFANGEFIGLLDSTNEKGETQVGFLHMFANATKNMTEAQRQQQIAQIFSQNATRAFIPLIGEYTDIMNSAAGSTDDGKKRLEELRQEFENTALQSSLFGDQWTLVSESIKVRMGQAMFGLRESFVRLGMIVAQVFLPIVEFADKVIRKFIEWGETHPTLAKGVIGIVAAFGVLAVTLGPLLMLLGHVVQGIAAIPTVLSTVKNALGLVSNAMTAFGGTLSISLGPLMLLAAVFGLIYFAWKRDIGGIQEHLGAFVGYLGNWVGAVFGVFDSLLSVIEAVFNTDREALVAALDNLGQALVEVLLVIPGQLLSSFGDIFTGLFGWLSDTFGTYANSFFTWGRNLIVSLVNGILSVIGDVIDAVSSIAEGIAQFFRSFSPPRYGPLKGIYLWGANLIGTFIDGMNSADIGAVSDIAGRIGDGLRASIKYGEGDANRFADTMRVAYQKAAEMLQTVKDGGRVSAEFFDPLQEQLGEWYNSIVKINLAYQEVYAVSSKLNAEQKRLELIQEQRKELERQKKLRDEAFDRALGVNDANYYGSQFAQSEIVDPTTAAGQQKIAQMQGSLSKEDFDSWIAWQRRVWEQQDTAQQQILDAEEVAQQAIIDNLNKQLDVAQAQYDLLVKVYELNEELLGLQEEQNQLTDKGGGGGGSSSGATYGTPEQLEEFRRQIKERVGDDSVILDEKRLKDSGEDDVKAYSDAVRQQEKEQKRLAELEEMNRSKKAEFELALINATSEEERQKIKEQKDAWDAAYKEEKSRLGERVSDAKAVTDAAETAADNSKAEREAEQEKKFAEDIVGLIGDQQGAIEDANSLKEHSGSLDEAAIKAKEQLRVEERKLRDLQAYGDQKKLDFERRIREAGDDPEKIRRIKEEQEAWETAYKKALEAQQARVEAARRADQDIGDQKTAEGGGKEKPDTSIKGGGGGIKAPDVPSFKDKLKEPTKPRDTEFIAKGIWEDVKAGWNSFKDKGFLEGVEAFFDQFAQIIIQGIAKLFGGNFEATYERFKNGLESFKRGVGIAGDWIKERAEDFKRGLGYLKDGAHLVGDWFQARVDDFKRGLGWLHDGIGVVIDGIVGLKDRFFSGLQYLHDGIGVVIDWFSSLWPDFLNDLSTVKDGWNVLVNWVGELLSGWWNAITTAWNDLSSWVSNLVSGWGQALKDKWNDLSTWVGNLLSSWGTALSGKWEELSTWVGNLLSNWWTDVTNGWDVLSTWVGNLVSSWGTSLSNNWNELSTWVGNLVSGWGTSLSNSWEELSTWVSDLVGEWSTALSTKWEELSTWVGELLTEWGTAIDNGWDKVSKFVGGFFTQWGLDIDAGWTTVTGVFTRLFNEITATFTNIKNAIQNTLNSITFGLVPAAGEGGTAGMADDAAAAGAAAANNSKGSGTPHADGLAYVPYDDYAASLHEGERVLTKDENRTFRGLIGALKALPGLFTSQIANATSSTQPVSVSRVNQTQTNRNATFGDVYIDADNPSSGQSLLESLAFLL